MLRQLKLLQEPPRRSTSPQDLVDQLLSLLPLGEGDLANQNQDPLPGPNLLEKTRHNLGNLKGLYIDNPPSVFNKQWIIPSHEPLHLSEKLPLLLPSRVWKYLMPARFWPKVTKWYHPSRGVKDKYPGFTQEHKSLAKEYLEKLYKAGVLYKRHSQHTWSIHPSVSLYSWETKRLIQHGTRTNEIDKRQESRRRRTPPKKGHRPCNADSPICSILRATNVRPNPKSANAPSVGTASTNQTPAKDPPSYIQDSAAAAASRPTSALQRDSTYRRRIQTTRTASSANAVAYSHPAADDSSSAEVKAAEDEVSSRSPNGYSCLPVGVSTARDDNCLSPSPESLEGHSGKFHGQHHSAKDLCDSSFLIRTASRIPRRVTGGLFLVDKNPHDSTHCRLVVDFSQFSRSPNMPFPKYWVPNLYALKSGLPVRMQRISLDLSEAFYHIPMSVGSSHHLLVSDGHRAIYGFRKAPMGVGLSPFLLHLFSSALATFIRSYYPVHCLAYMDDFLLSARDPATLSSCCTHILCAFSDWGIRINFDKSTPAPLTSLRFLGYEITDTDIRPHAKAMATVADLLRSLRTYVLYDYKVIQRFLGHLAWVAPFTVLQYLLLQPMYTAAAHKHDFSFSRTYKSLLISNFGHYHRQQLGFRPKQPSAFVDATLTSGAAVTTNGRFLWAVTFPGDQPIHVYELCVAAACAYFQRPRSLGSDSLFVCYRSFASLPLLFALRCMQLLFRLPVAYVPSARNPADAPTRGRATRPFSATRAPLPFPLFPPPPILPVLASLPCTLKRKSRLSFKVP